MPPRFQHPGFGGHPGFGAGGAIFMILLLILVVLAIIWIFNTFTHRHHHLHHDPGPQGIARTGHPPFNPEAQRILEERFARGEIDADEFKLKRDLLRDNS
jgi:putative membrane protein